MLGPEMNVGLDAGPIQKNVRCRFCAGPGFWGSLTCLVQATERAANGMTPESGVDISRHRGTAILRLKPDPVGRSDLHNRNTLCTNTSQTFDKQFVPPPPPNCQLSSSGSMQKTLRPPQRSQRICPASPKRQTPGGLHGALTTCEQAPDVASTISRAHTELL